MKKGEIESNQYKLEVKKYRKLIREVKNIREKSMAGKAYDNRKEFLKNIRN